ncbi:STAS domain-containing protein [Thiobacillus sp.]|uniref:STAS domain-containing protein n=1 Tax=Thiobacillus sp. TaxID=924 RepID=UPI001831903B|nr:STAS domain-containing protein [Thiobacillus sp.]MBC2731914.1 STAS domain-containing protein [Thiobacillus sp.]MBC2740652.1 STAS domain-containing protein [Thiobacillus sp.]MBC2758495.1 STAS domain-containing protein [Thiobacillus sp.]
MDIPSERRAACLYLQPAGEMTIYSAAELKPVLLDALGRSEEIEVHLADVGELDTSGVQLLMLLKREAAAAGKVLKLTGHSAAVLDVFELMGLGNWFGDPQLLPAGDGETKRTAA